MTKLTDDHYKTNDLFGKSEENLQQMPARFKKSTLDEIERISECHGISKARVIRKLVGLGLKEVKNRE
jgi:phage-related protein